MVTLNYALCSLLYKYSFHYYFICYIVIMMIIIIFIIIIIITITISTTIISNLLLWPLSGHTSAEILFNISNNKLAMLRILREIAWPHGACYHGNTNNRITYTSQKFDFINGCLCIMLCTLHNLQCYKPLPSRTEQNKNNSLSKQVAHITRQL